MVFAVPKNAVRFFFVEMIRNKLRYTALAFRCYFLPLIARYNTK